MRYLKNQVVISEGKNADTDVIELRKYFRISRLTGLSNLIPEGAFRISDDAHVNRSALGAWLCLCSHHTSGPMVNEFDPECIGEIIFEVKKVMNSGKSEFRKDLQNMFAGYGIDFNIVPYFPGVPVQGYIRKKDYRIYQMFLTRRGASADIFWFSLFHELGHIANGDISRSGIYIDGEKSKNVQREKMRICLQQMLCLSLIAADVFLKMDLSHMNPFNHMPSAGGLLRIL